MKTFVVKIGGSTLGSHDTTLEDLVELQRQGKLPIVIHGGAKVTSEWLARLNIPTTFKDGLRVTDAETLKVVVAALGGLVNKELVVAIQARGGKAIGLSGCDGNMLHARIKSPELGLVGEIIAVDPRPLQILLNNGYIPVVAPVSLGVVSGKMTVLNVNGDTAAAEIAAAVSAEKLIFLTDVDGIHDQSGKRIDKLSIIEAKNLIVAGVASGGMIPKIEASVTALKTVPMVRIVDGRVPHALLNEAAGTVEGMNGFGGTSIVAN
jgi:acetylglutamate kinase